MTAPGTIGELYLDADNPSSTLGAPPAAPAPVPTPTKVEVTKPVVTKARMADEKPDGSIRDTSTEAITNPSKDLGFRNLDDEQKPPTQPAEKSAEEKPAETKPVEAPKPADPAPAEKLYAGKFKSPEELEKGYEEAQKLITKQGNEKAELQRAALVPRPEKTPQQVAAEQAEANQLLNELVTNPKEFIQEKVVRQTLVALTAQQARHEWIKNNPDLAEHEIRVAFEVTQLIQSDPDLARDPAALLTKATDNFRQFTGKIRTEGAREALTQETRTIPLLSNTAPSAATEQPSLPKAPKTQGDVTDAHVAWLKTQEQRSHRGLRR
jgi:hypothetical protein